MFAQLLAASPAGDEASARDPGAVAVELAEARASYAAALADSDFREDAPAVRAVAEAVAPALVEAWRSPPLRNQAIELMQATAGDGLRPFLAAEPAVRFALARPWLRWHDEPGALADFAASDRGALLRVVALYHPDHAAEPLLAALRDSDPAFGREAPCHSALLLPPRERRALVEAAIPTLTAQAPRDNWPSCIRLALEHPAGRRWLEGAVIAEARAPDPAP
ncbi:MAG: hypothetical protein JWM10_1267, partial [Myxococcaceae bacterium]|nr:hypothetical protein [Myxococcaceae bacterium]